MLIVSDCAFYIISPTTVDDLDNEIRVVQPIQSNFAASRTQMSVGKTAAATGLVKLCDAAALDTAFKL